MRSILTRSSGRIDRNRVIIGRRVAQPLQKDKRLKQIQNVPTSLPSLILKSGHNYLRKLAILAAGRIEIGRFHARIARTHGGITAIPSHGGFGRRHF